MATQIIGLTTPIMALIFAATFFAIWRWAGLGTHVLGFAMSYVFFAVGFTVTHILPTDAAYLFHTSQVFYSLGAASIIWGACARVGQRTNVKTLTATYVISALTLLVAVNASGDAAPRLLIANTGYGIMFLIGMMALVWAPRSTTIDKWVIAIIALNGIDFLVRPTLTLLVEQSIPAAAYRESLYYSIINLVLAIKAVSTAIALIGATIADALVAIRQRSDEDSLTGLKNRRAFEAEASEMLERAKQSQVPVSLVVADIDHFKQVNDLWGHQAGDKAIASFSELIEREVRKYDLTARIGGEEFCILVWDCDEAKSHRLAERLRLAFAHLRHDGLNSDVRLTASFGVAEWSEGEAYRKFFARCDERLYDAKRSGRNLVVSSGVERRKESAIASSEDQEKFDLPLTKAG